MMRDSQGSRARNFDSIKRQKASRDTRVLGTRLAPPNAALMTFAADASKPVKARDYARQIMQMKDKIGPKQRAEATASTESLLRQQRRERMKAVSDEALIDLDDYTMTLAAKRK